MKKITPIILLSLITYSCAQEKQETETYVNKFAYNTNDLRKYVHQSIVNLSSNIDNYFDDEVSKIDNYHSSYGLIELSAFQNQHENINFDQKVKIKLTLPKLKDRFRIEFESDEERENIDFVENHTDNRNKDFNLSLVYDKVLRNIDLKAKLGVKLNSKLDPFVKISAKKEWLKNDYKYKLSQSFKESVVKKLESTTSFLTTKKLTDKYNINNYNEIYWQSGESSDIEFYNSLYLNHRYDKNDYFSYIIDLNTNNNDTNMRIKRYSAKVKYRRYLKPWLYLDAIPENYYNYDLNFKPRYAIRFNLGMYFNQSSYKK